MTAPVKKSLASTVRKLFASKSKREIARLISKRKLKGKCRPGPLMQASNAWQRWEEKLLGKEPDFEVARKTGRTLNSVRIHRRLLGIACLPNPRFWTEEDMSLNHFLDHRELATLRRWTKPFIPKAWRFLVTDITERFRRLAITRSISDPRILISDSNH